MNRTLLAKSHNGEQTYWRDSDSEYVYQRRESDQQWIGWLCTMPTWERSFFPSGTFGPYSEYSPAHEKAIKLQVRNWRCRIERTRDGWMLYAVAPDRAELESQHPATQFAAA